MYDILCKEPSDINELLPILKELAENCEHITEMGVRKIVSTWAFVEGIKENGTVVAIDNETPEYYGATLKPIENRAKERHISFRFLKDDTRTMTIEETDLLFIDTNHTYHQLQRELQNHSDKARKYIVLHDTTSCPEMLPAINELVEKKVWHVKKVYNYCNGLTILRRDDFI